MKLRHPGQLLAMLFALASCTSNDGQGSTDPLSPDEVAPVAENYATMIAANYAQSRASAQALRDAIDDLVATPDDASLDAARQAWLAAREPYGQTEVYRFYDGPIDNPDDGPEGQLNAWPMDEAYVDYVEGMPDAGIINDLAAHPSIDAALIASLNEQGGETNIASGYHAIEFLLWGQDQDPRVRARGRPATTTPAARARPPIKTAAACTCKPPPTCCSRISIG
jgi:putative iron-regulated protein